MPDHAEKLDNLEELSILRWREIIVMCAAFMFHAACYGSCVFSCVKDDHVVVC